MNSNNVAKWLHFHPLPKDQGERIVNDMDINNIGSCIRRYRNEKRLSQDELSKLSGVSYNTIVKLERKTVPANPTIGTLRRISGVLGMEIGELIKES